MKKGNNLNRLFGTGKCIFVSLFSMMALTAVNAQTNSQASTDTAPAVGIETLPLKPFRMPSLQDVGGSPFLSAEYRQGSVELGQGRTVTNVPLRFNTFNNAMMVSKDGQDLKLEFFEFVSYDEMDSKGSAKHYQFKAGYPEIDGHSDNTIYQVLSMGPKVHLLKYISQKVEDVPTLGDYSRREIVTTEQFYVYVPGGEIKKIQSLKNGKKSLQEALPEMSEKIAEIANANNLKLKSEADIAALVEELNKP